MYAMSKKNTKETVNTEEKVGGFVDRNRKGILLTTIIVLIAVCAVCVSIAVIENANTKGIEKIDVIEYALTKDSSTATDDEISARQNTALQSLTPFLGKKSIVGVRANMLAADISMQKKDYENSRTYWLAAANVGKKAYTAPLCKYNAAVCSEELNDNANAITYYQQAADAKDFFLVAHTLFSLGRVKEATGDFAGAAEAYKKLVDSYSDDSWTKLAQSRLIALSATGKVTE